MRTRLDNILLGILWLLAATLGASFWLNTKYGFNIFSAPHWQYLAYLQASKAPVAASFYISLGICVFITIFGLYFLIQPKLRKIVFPPKDIKPANRTTEAPTTITADRAPEQKKSDIPEIVIPAQITQSAPQSEPTPQPIATQVPAQNTAVATSNVTRPTPLRPPHLTLPTNNSYTAAPIPTATIQNTANNDGADNAVLSEIFTQNGYLVKKNPYIAGWQPNLLAIGTNEVMWIGGIGATTHQVKQAIDKLNQIFSDTLDDIYIGINGFSINAPDAQTTEFNDILLFDTNDDLSNYIATHKNPAPAAEEKENFDAYSEYIDTVIGYIGKL